MELDRGESIVGAEGLFWELPLELVVWIFSFLDIASLLRMSSTCSYFHAAASLPELWGELVPRELGQEAISSLFLNLADTPATQTRIEIKHHDKVAQPRHDKLTVFGVQKRTKIFRPALLPRTQATSTLLPFSLAEQQKCRGRVASFPPLHRLLFKPNSPARKETTEPEGKHKDKIFPPTPKWLPCVAVEVARDAAWRNLYILYSTVQLHNNYILDQLKQGHVLTLMSLKYLTQRVCISFPSLSWIRLTLWYEWYM